MSRATDITTNGTHAAERRRGELPAPAVTLSVTPDRVSGRRIVQPCAALFLATMEREGLTHARIVDVPRDEVELSGVGPVALSWRGEEYHDVVLLPPGAVVMITSHHG